MRWAEGGGVRSQVTEPAVTSIEAAGGSYLGILAVETAGPEALRTAIHGATEEAGGTHLREAEQTVGGERRITGLGDQRTGDGYRWLSAPEQDAHAVSGVFRIEPGAWPRLHPAMLPLLNAAP